MNEVQLVRAWQAKIHPEQEARVGYRDSGIFRLQLTPDDRYALTLNFQYRKLIVWDFQTGKRLLSRDWGGYDKVRDLYLTPDGNYAVVIGETGGVVPLFPDLPDPPKLLPREDYAVVNARSGRAISSNGRQARVWDFEKQYFTVTLQIPPIHRKDDTWAPLGIHSISEDGKYGSGMFDFHALIWDLEDGKVLWHHDFSQRPPNQRIFFTPDGQQIVITFMSRIETWRWNTDQMDGPAFDTHAGTRLHRPVFTPDGQTLITGADNGTIEVWDWSSGRLKKTLAGHRHNIQCLAVSADGEYLASTSEDSTLRKWHLASGQQVFSTLRAAQNPELLAIDPEGHFFICQYGRDGATLAVCDLASGTVQRILKGHQGDINAIDFLADGRLISGSDDHTLRVWNLESGTCLQTLSGEHTDKVKAVVAVAKPDRAVSAGADGRIVRWNLSTGRPVRPPLTNMPPSRQHEQFVFIDKRGHFAMINRARPTDPAHGDPILIDLTNGNEKFTWYSLHINGMLSPSGRWLIQPRSFNTLKIIHIGTQKIIQVQIEGEQTRLGQHWCFTPDEKKLICSCNHQVIVIDLDSGDYRFAPVQGTPSRPLSIHAIAISPDGQLGVLAADESIQIWEIQSEKVLGSVNTGIVFTVALDPRNRYLVVGGYTEPMHCFELRVLDS